MEVKLYIVVPCYNEEEVIKETASRLKKKIIEMQNQNIIGDKSRIIFVDDGSKDQTWDKIKEFQKEERLFEGVKLSRNRGHQNALLAGLMYAKEYADIVISMDADLQDDIDAVTEMVQKYREGFDIVYGVRSSRKKDSFFKKSTAQTFYKIMSILGADLIYDHADYRLMSKRALDGLAEFDEVNLFLRGIIPQIGYSSTIVEYERQERFAGESKYPLNKMVAFALDGITSFSIKPIRFVVNMGFILFACSIVAIIYSLISKIWGNTVSGWTSTILSIWLLGSIQILCIGIIGEYIGKTYSETKKRPKYIIETIIKTE